MRRLLVLAAVTALAVARPETYKEKEDFQYSRSSSDDGTKSGYYGAQRGNMGGNYERAHNMDALAQHQMGSLVRTVDGELGDGAKEKSGSVFTAANSRGMYGSGHYDLSNLEGRNFQEGTTFGDSQSHSSLSSHLSGFGSQAHSYSSAANSAYGSQSQNTRYQGYRTGSHSDQALYANNMQSADNLQASQYDDTQSGHGAEYHSQGQHVYDQTAASHHLSNTYGASNTHGTHYRLVGASPVKIYVRPGSTVTVPVAAQSYDASHGSSSTLDQNSINEAEVLGTHDHRAVIPTSDAKHYESSYSYRKEWEKHSAVPVTAVPLAIPTVNPYPVNSELHEDAHSRGSQHLHEASAQAAQNVQSGSQYRGYNVKSGSSHHQSAYDTQEHSGSDSAAASVASSIANTHGAYNYGASNLNSANLNSQVEDFRSKPKSYQSSYSYHKSWERQGDPYVIQPSANGLYTATDLQSSQRLTSLNQGSSYGLQQNGAHYHQGHQGYSSDCDENGHIRVARSYQQRQTNNQGQYVGQHSQNLEDLGQLSQSAHDFSQQSQNLEDLGQQSQNLEDFGQQSQNSEDLGQQSQNLEDFSQQSQNLEDLGQQSQSLQDFGQQSQNLEDLGQQPQNLEDLGQQTQTLEDLGQQSQNLHNFNQESQNLEDFGQQSQNVNDLGQQPQKLEDFVQQAQDVGQLSQNHFDKMEDLGQQSQNQWDQQSQKHAGQEPQNIWDTLKSIQNSNNQDTVQQSQGGLFDIHQPELLTVEDNKPNPAHPFAHTFESNHPDQVSTDLGKEDIEKEFMQSEDVGRQPGQQTQTFWQSFESNMNQNNQNAYVPISVLDSDRTYKDRMDWQKYLENHHIHTGTSHIHNQHDIHRSGYGGSSWHFQPSDQTQGYVNTRYDPNSWGFDPAYSHALSGHRNIYTNTQTSYTPGLTNPQTYYTPGLTNTQTYYTPGLTNIQAYYTPGLTNAQTYHTPGLTNVQTYYTPGTTNTHTYYIPGSNIQTYVTRYNHSTHSTSNIYNTSQGSSTSLTNIWDLIDDKDKQTSSANETDFNSKGWYQDNKVDGQINTNYDLTQSLNENSLNNNDNVDLNESSTSTTTTSKVKLDNLHPHDVERGDIEPDKQIPQEEAGRGDIGPQDSPDDDSSTANKPLEIFETKPTNHTLYETHGEIEKSSSAKENIKTTTENLPKHGETQINLEKENNQSEAVLGVLSLDEQKHHSEQVDSKLQRDTRRTSITSTTQKSYGYAPPQYIVEQESLQDYEHQVSSGQDNLEQQSYNQFESFDQQNVDHKPIDFGQQSETLESFNHQNINLHLPTLGQSPEEPQQQNTEQQFETLGQQTEDLNQQSFNQFEDLGQQVENLGQEHQVTDTFGQQSETLESFNQQNLNLEQQNINPHLPTLGQSPEEPQQQNTEQQFETLGQQTEDLNQKSLNQFEDMGQQVENLGQEQQVTHTFGQQSEGFQQESLGDFGQHEQLQQESLQNFDQLRENLNPQNEQLHKFDQENQNLEQLSQSVDQWKQIEQQQNPDVEVLVPHSFNNKEGRTPVHQEPVIEPENVKEATFDVDKPPEPVTEKAGFWNKVGSKFVTAKDKVKSWFSSS